MNNFLQSKYVITGALFFIAFVFLIASLYVKQSRDLYVSATKDAIAKQEGVLLKLSSMADSERVDEMTNEVVKDCNKSERAQFDDLLGKLANLSQSELIDIDSLFSACADFYSQRKVLTSARLVEEFEDYLELVDLLSIADHQIDWQSYKVEKWEEIVELERQRSTMFSQLVLIQGDIIDAMLSGSSVQSEDIQNLLNQAQEINDLLIYTNAQVDAARSRLGEL